MIERKSPLALVAAIPALASAVSAVRCLTGSVRQALTENQIEFRGLRVSYLPDHGEDGDLVVSFEARLLEGRSTSIMLLQHGIEDGDRCYRFRDITSYPMRGMFHRIDAVVEEALG